MFKLMDKKIIAILCKLFFLNWPYGVIKVMHRTYQIIVFYRADLIVQLRHLFLIRGCRYIDIIHTQRPERHIESLTENIKTITSVVLEYSAYKQENGNLLKL